MNVPSLLFLMTLVGVQPQDTPLAEVLRKLDDNDHEVRQKSLMALKSSGADSKMVVDKLTFRLKQEPYDELRGQVLLLLGQVARTNDDALAPLIEALDNTFLFAASLHALRNSKIKAEKLAPALWKAMDKGSPLAPPIMFFGGPHPVINAMASLGKPAIPYLLKGLQSPSKSTRRHAALGLGIMGRQAEPLLLKALDSPNPLVREAVSFGAIELACRSDDFETTARKVVTLLLRDKDWRVRKSAAESLGGAVGLIDDRFTPDLRRALKDQHREVRCEVLKLLGRLQTSAKDSLPDVLPLLRDDSESVIVQALEVLPALGHPPAEYLPSVLELVRSDPNRTVRLAAVKSLQPFGSRAREIVPVVLEALAFRHAFAPDQEAEDIVYFQAFGAIGPDAKAAIPLLNRAVNGPAKGVEGEVTQQERHSLEACFALAKIGYCSDQLVACLSNHLARKETTSLTDRCLAALTDIGPKAAAALPVLDQLLARHKMERERFFDFEGDQPRERFAIPYVSIHRDDPQELRKCLLKFRAEGMLLERWADAFVRLPLRAEAGVPALIAALEKYPEVRKGPAPICYFRPEVALVHRLALFGAEAKAAAPLLLRILKDDLPSDLKTHAALALVEIGASDQAGDALLPALRHGIQPDNGVEYEIKGRIRYGTVGSPALCCRCLGALLRLRAIEPNEAIPVLLRAQNGTATEQAAALQALTPFVKTHPEVARAFRIAIDSQSHEARTIAQTHAYTR